MRLQSKFILLLVPLIVVPLLVLGATAYREVRDIAEKRAIEQMTLLLDQMQHQVRSRIDTAVASVQLFSNHTLVHKYALTDDEFQRFSVLQRPLLSQFGRFQQAFPDYHTIRFIDPDGFESARWSRNDAVETLSLDGELDDAFLAQLSATVDEDRAFFLPPHDDGLPRLIAVTDLRLVNDIDTDPSAPVRLRGYLAVTVELSGLAEQLRNRQVLRNGTVMLIDGESRILLGPGPGESWSGRNGAVPEAIQGLMTDSDGLPQRGQWDGIPAVVQTRTVHGEGIRLLAVVPESDIKAAEQSLGRQMLAITVGAVVITPILVLLALGRLVVTPLVRLSSAADSIGEGKLTTAVPVGGSDEVGMLTRRFDSMRIRLDEMHRKLSHQAYHDSLTALPNRRLLQEVLDHALPEARRYDERIAVLFLDLDEFKRINDTRGHAVGDMLLQNIAQRLSDGLRDEDYLATVTEPCADLISRIGGDEFIILINRLSEGRDAGRIADRLLKLIARPFTIEGSEFTIGASIGIAVFPDDSGSADDLIRCADIAMYEAKSRGRNRIMFYSPDLDGEFRLRARMEERLRTAISEKRLSLHYQPQVDTVSGRINGVEALARWYDEESGWIPPSQFIPVAESAGMIAPLTRWALEEACNQARAWDNAGLPAITVAVNVSGSEIVNATIVEAVQAALDESGLEPGRLMLEVTESTLIDADDAAVQTFDRLRAMGVGLALDDFGTGYSSLSYLRRFRFNRIKIDRNFVAAMDSGHGDPALVNAIISMAHELDMAVVAEGVETETQLEILRAHDCESVQGYLFSRPLDATSIHRLLLDEFPFANRCAVHSTH